MANFKVAAVFSSNMVLQRNKNISVFGLGENGAVVSVTLDGNTVTAVVNNDKWTAVLPPHKEATDLTMTIKCNDTVKTFTNIAVGEVWLAGGQSNMEFELANSKGGKEMMDEDNNVNVRFYYTPKKSYIDDDLFEAEASTSWELTGSEGMAKWSAVGYIFAKRLSAELNVTVGVIGCNWGGTSASNWLDKSLLENEQDMSIYFDKYNAASKGKTTEQQIKEFDDYLIFQTEWEKKCNKLYEENPTIEWDEVQRIIGTCVWPGPINCKNPYRPGGLYETMLKRVAPYTLRGFIYYQGEDDADKFHLYEKLMYLMIGQWRTDWKDNTLPFLITQLPMHRYKGDEDNKTWCYIREAQMNAYKTIKNTGIAVIPDCGEFNNIHPLDKVPVGERLALQALYSVYARIPANDAFGPIYSSLKFMGDSLELHFEYAEDGFKTTGDVTGFEVAGTDRKYYPATAKINGSVITVSASEVKEPIYARYAWSNYIEVSVFGKNMLPLAPFRTSCEDEVKAVGSGKTDIKQIMEL